MVRALSRTAWATVAILLATAALGCNSASTADSSATATAMVAEAAVPIVTPGPHGPKIRIVTALGTIVVLLDPVHAPKTVANFLSYTDKKFFDGGSFFRAIPGFVIQGGNKTRESPSDQPIPLEDPQTTGLRNVNGAIAMARTSDPDSGTSEFFIDDGPQRSLDGAPGSPGYAPFGVVVSGMDVVRKIVHMPANGEYLINPVKIIKIERVH
jgi:peptidyl-prolyl cis-trans isomerase A (cyclophilin A)